MDGTRENKNFTVNLNFKTIKEFSRLKYIEFIINDNVFL